MFRIHRLATGPKRISTNGADQGVLPRFRVAVGSVVVVLFSGGSTNRVSNGAFDVGSPRSWGRRDARIRAFYLPELQRIVSGMSTFWEIPDVVVFPVADF